MRLQFGKYNPDWAIAFHEGKVKHIYFVAETKGSISTMQLRLVEEAKIHCAREYIKAMTGNSNRRSPAEKDAQAEGIPG